MSEKRYGEKILSEFDVEKDLEIWENKHERDYTIKITLPEFCCLCPRSGYPDFATIYVEYVPQNFVVELKAIKLYINSFMNKNISHEDSINEIYGVLEQKLQPKFLKVVGDFNPRGNVHTIIEICSQNLTKTNATKPTTKAEQDGANLNYVAVENTIAAKYNEPRDREFSKRSFGSREKSGGARGGFKSGGRNFADKKGDKKFSKDDKFTKDKPRKSAPKEGFKKPEFSGEKRARVVKKDK